MPPVPHGTAPLDRLLAHRSEIERRHSSLGASGRIVPTSESIPPEHGLVIRDLVTESKARTILEVGLGNALSTMYLCEPLVRRGGWRPGDVVTIDPYQNDVDDVGLTNLVAAGLQPLVAVHPELSQLVLPRLVGDGRQFDLAFIDGDHLFDRVFVDLFFVDMLVKAPGVVVLDDAYLASVHWALDFFVRNCGWTLREAPFRDGSLGFSPRHCRMAVAQLPEERVERDWDHFEPFGNT